MAKSNDTLTTGQVAKAMGISSDTVRKRADRGLIPCEIIRAGKKLLRTFRVSSLVAAGIKPWANQGQVLNSYKVPNRTRAIFVIDRSSSMSGLGGFVGKAIESNVAELRKGADGGDVYEVGFITFSTTVDAFSGFTDVRHATVPLISASGMTALNDAIYEAADTLRREMDNDPKLATLLVVITDGQENQSKRPDYQVGDLIRRNNGTDRFTLVANCPPGGESYFTRINAPAGNVRPWEQTVQGVQSYQMVSSNALNSYVDSRSIGATYTTSFYAQPVTGDANKFAQKLDDKLDEVTGEVKVERVGSSDPNVIQKFCQSKFGGFERGKYYYQLAKSEKVQDYKQIIVQDKTTGKFYTGWKAAKQLLSIPEFSGTVKIRPGSLGEFNVFVQSTSMNRKLTPGTAVVKLR